jgi:GNAT superfamily N-acetyltransferase
MIHLCPPSDHDRILAVINSAAGAYRGVIPADRWHEPYFSATELRDEIDDGVRFWGSYGPSATLDGVMGLQDRGPVLLIRHAYVRPPCQRTGTGSRLLVHLLEGAERPVLVGTWAAATWAIAFYRRHGFELLAAEETPATLTRYWRIPAAQVEASVVLRRNGPAGSRL